MKENMLSAGNRDALQGMLEVAIGLGVATVFALFFAGRRKSSTAIFEVTVIVAVFTLVALTATACIVGLHEGNAIANDQLTRVAMPLAVAAFVLVFTMAFARLPGSPAKAFALFPLALAASVVAARVALAVGPVRPGASSLAAVLIVGVAALLGVCASGFDRVHMAWGRRDRVRELVRVELLGYTPSELTLRFGLPRPMDDRAALLPCLVKQGRAYLDIESCEALRKEVNRCWRDFTSGEGRRPLGSSILARVRILYRIPGVRSDVAVRVETVESGRELHRSLKRNDDGFFDATEFLDLEALVQA